ncbi:MAG: EamA family transporter [Anaerolineae bacterium]|nr:EamA family transporter [Anaerolineae bacterium]MDW8098275.1 EamA family transporter [Anaerolineae bacterium]
MGIPIVGRHRASRLAQSLAAHQTDLLLISMVFVWGANFSVLKIAFHTFSPLAFNVLRFLLATTLLLGFLRWHGQPVHIARADLWRVTILGVIGHGVYQVFFVQGLARTTAANASLLMATVPIFVALLSALFHIERVTPRRWIGIFLSFAGIFLITVGSGQQIHFSASHLTGDLLMLASAATWATYTVMSKPLLTRYSPLCLTAVSMVPGTAALALLGMPDMLSQRWSAVEPAAWAGLIYSAVFSIALAYLIWFTGVQRVGNARTAIYSNGTPVVASLLAWVVLREPFGVLQIIGGGVILIGLVLTQSNGSNPSSASSIAKERGQNAKGPAV